MRLTEQNVKEVIVDSSERSKNILSDFTNNNFDVFFSKLSAQQITDYLFENYFLSILSDNQL